ncbi:MAG TPA: pyridoxal phosphate-dependent aminotransferase [Longimicrobiales bacterium]|nr:pyridoxal phosphate-dependent aminotransferase [Longimicrobiales bacterium]
MRRNILHAGAGNLRYEIREIVSAAIELKSLGQPITWENIGDPVQKGEAPPSWIREIVAGLLERSESWAYCETRGVSHVREYLAERVNARGGVRVTPEDIIFFNGLGDAVAKVYGFLSREARVLGPSPAYSTHSSAEAAHSGYEHVTYELDPYNGWMPDLDDIRNKVRYNDSIAGILLLSPDNPTGAVYPREILEAIAAIAAENDVFIIADEIYANIVYDGRGRLNMSEWIGDVPGIAMRGISKEYPWPGARCGWLEVLNKGRDHTFARYVESLIAAKRLEVSSTTLPQMSIPHVMSDPRYEDHLAAREAKFAGRAEEVMAAFAGCEHVIVNKPCGAFYYTVMFKPGVLRDDQRLEIQNPRVAAAVDRMVDGVEPDKRFVYYLMGATGIVVVPLTGFQCAHHGFRGTLLEADDAKRAWILKSIRDAIDEYVASGSSVAAKVKAG